MKNKLKNSRENWYLIRLWLMLISIELGMEWNQGNMKNKDKTNDLPHLYLRLNGKMKIKVP
jgi:hypothetical protein